MILTLFSCIHSCKPKPRLLIIKFIILLFLFSLNASAEITFQWLGITGFTLSDGKTTLLFDPVVTRPGLFDILFRRSVKTDQKLVETWIKKANLNKIDAIFISHSHHDHSLDMPAFAKKLNSPVYGSRSSITIAKSFGVKEDTLKTIKVDEVLEVGDFKITVVENEHAPILGPIYFAAGEIEEKVDEHSSVFDYRMGDSFGYFIEHKEGKVLFQATSKYPKKYESKGFESGVLLFSVAKNATNDHLITNIISLIKPHLIIPLHFDNFFKPIENDQVEYLFGVDMEAFKKSVARVAPLVSVTEPKYVLPIKLY